MRALASCRRAAGALLQERSDCPKQRPYLLGPVGAQELAKGLAAKRWRPRRRVLALLARNSGSVALAACVCDAWHEPTSRHARLEAKHTKCAPAHILKLGL